MKSIFFLFIFVSLSASAIAENINGIDLSNPVGPSANTLKKDVLFRGEKVALHRNKGIVNLTFESGKIIRAKFDRDGLPAIPIWIEENGIRATSQFEKNKLTRLVMMVILQPATK